MGSTMIEDFDHDRRFFSDEIDMIDDYMLEDYVFSLPLLL